MRIICIDSSNNPKYDTSGHLLKEGKVYKTQYDGPCTNIDGRTVYGYALVGFERGRGFSAERFVPLSKIDEREYALVEMLNVQQKNDMQ